MSPPGSKLPPKSAARRGTNGVSGGPNPRRGDPHPSEGLQESLLDIPGGSDANDLRTDSAVEFETAFMALSKVSGLGANGLRALVSALDGRLGLVFETTPDHISGILSDARVPGANKIASTVVDRSTELQLAGAEAVESMRARQVQLLGPQEMPPKFRSLRDGPKWLFVQGDPAALQHGPAVAVVGTRQATPSGERAAAAVVRTMAAYPLTLVSGLANGIDNAAHRAALQDGVRNVAFLGHGIDVIFPAETASTRADIVAAGGAVASEYLPGDHYKKQYFVQRNRLQAGLADLVIPVEGEESGGTAHTVRFANGYGRQILGLTWPSAGSITRLVEAQEHGQLVAIFTAEGRQHIDRIVRELAAAYGHETNALSLVEKQLTREATLRTVSVRDLAGLRDRIDGLEREISRRDH